ncbi:MAG TPA: RNase adapter RapZ [Erysipelothrix sp.]|nr:RNase adapter RapZ [Erysipelothrix sp.]
MSARKIILVTGMSGAGKTSAMGILEDMGYHAIDQFPPQLLRELIHLAVDQQDPRFDNLAIATGASDLPDFVRRFRNIDADMRVLYLEADEKTLLSRYKSTRRTHPMLLSNKAKTLEEAIEIEKEMFEEYKEKAYLSINTSNLTEMDLRRKLTEGFRLSSSPVFSISFISFGFKNGIPMDSDLLFDVRFLKNPFWVEELKHENGENPLVKDFVLDEPQTQEYIKLLENFLDYSFKEYVKEGKNHFTVAIGCTGGQHRSVVLVNWLYNRFSNEYQCYKRHRDMKVNHE